MTSASMRTGSGWRGPPCTTRCPTAWTRPIAWIAASSLAPSTCPPVASNSCSPLTSSPGPTTLTLSELDPALTTRTRILVRPLPVRDVGRVFAVVARVLAVLQALVDHVLAGVRRPRGAAGHAVAHLRSQVEAVPVRGHEHVGQRGRGGPLPVYPPTW